MPQFYTVLTDVGQAKIANAIALGQTIEITELAVGDGFGSLPTPDSSAEALVNEVRRAPINTSDTDPDNPSWIVVEQVLPPDVGGWTIREIGIYDVDGDLIGIGNYPETYKPVLAEGSSRTQTVRFVLEVSDTSAVTLKVDPAVVLATREYVDQQREEHEDSRNHPLATPTERGMVEKATDTEAKSGAADKYPDAEKLKAVLNYHGVGDTIELVGGSDLNDVTRPGLYLYISGGKPINAPHSGGAYMLVLNRGNANLPIQFYYRIYSTNVHFRARTGLADGDPWTNWEEFFHSGNQLSLGTTPSSARSALELDSAAQDPRTTYAFRENNLTDLADKVAAFEAIKQLATTTLAGVVEKATTIEAKSGTAGKFPDAAGVAAYFEEAEQQLGVGQTWQDLTTSRSGGVTYTNSTGRPIYISVTTRDPSATSNTSITVDGIQVSSFVNVNASGANAINTHSAIVPDGSTYSVDISASNDELDKWLELR